MRYALSADNTMNLESDNPAFSRAFSFSRGLWFSAIYHVFVPPSFFLLCRIVKTPPNARELILRGSYAVDNEKTSPTAKKPL